MSNNNQQGTLKQAMLAGACAGTAVDTVLFPLGKVIYPCCVSFFSMYILYIRKTRSKQDYNHNMASLPLEAFEASTLVY